MMTDYHLWSLLKGITSNKHLRAGMMNAIGTMKAWEESPTWHLFPAYFYPLQPHFPEWYHQSSIKINAQNILSTWQHYLMDNQPLTGHKMIGKTCHRCHKTSSSFCLPWHPIYQLPQTVSHGNLAYWIGDDPTKASIIDRLGLSCPTSWFCWCTSVVTLVKHIVSVFGGAWNKGLT